MDSTGDSFLLQVSGLSAIDLDDPSGDAAITIIRSRRLVRFPLMRLPREIRLGVFSFLLPDVHEIDSGNEGGYTEEAGSDQSDTIWTTYRHDGARCETAIMQTNHQIYAETASYLYERLTLIVHIADDGVDFLTAHYGCGCIRRCLSIHIPLHKFKCIWLQVCASSNQRKHLVHIRRNLLDFCGKLYHLESMKSLRVDFWDECHRQMRNPFSFSRQAVGLFGFEGRTSTQSGVAVVTRKLEKLRGYHDYAKENAEAQIWRAANSTGTALVATDMELILQPLKLLRNVGICEIFLTPHLQRNKSLVDAVASYKESI